MKKIHYYIERSVKVLKKNPVESIYIYIYIWIKEKIKKNRILSAILLKYVIERLIFLNRMKAVTWELDHYGRAFFKQISIIVQSDLLLFIQNAVWKLLQNLQMQKYKCLPNESETVDRASAFNKAERSACGNRGLWMGQR